MKIFPKFNEKILNAYSRVDFETIVRIKGDNEKYYITKVWKSYRISRAEEINQFREMFITEAYTMLVAGKVHQMKSLLNGHPFFQLDKDQRTEKERMTSPYLKKK